MIRPLSIPRNGCWVNSMVRLGILGLSAGNGHPYSWSAIINGYQPELMENCGFPVIPRYLEQQQWPGARIQNAQITHVWCQDKAIAATIAATCFIDQVVDDYKMMIGAVDAILLARDDAENHLPMALPFIKAGLPIYIDKPICLSVNELGQLLEQQSYPGQIFSCSALRYASELQLSAVQRQQLGQLQHIQAVVPKDWMRYAIHIIEPLLLIVGNNKLLSSHRISHEEKCSVTYQWQNGMTAEVIATGSQYSPIAMRLFGDQGWLDLLFNDTFSAFKNTLEAFIDSVITKRAVIDSEFYYRVVTMLEKGLIQ